MKSRKGGGFIFLFSNEPNPTLRLLRAFQARHEASAPLAGTDKVKVLEVRQAVEFPAKPR